MREHFFEVEARRLVGCGFTTTAGYKGVPAGTVGVVVDAYEAGEGGWGVWVMWLRRDDRELLDALRNQFDGPAPLMDGFSRADFLVEIDAPSLGPEETVIPMVALDAPFKDGEGGVPTVCRGCGCTHSRPCQPPCSWVNRHQTLCSSCAHAPEEVS